MLLQEEIKTGVAILIYGTSGIGKSTLCSLIKNSVFIDLENGLRNIKGIKKTKVLKKWPEFKEHLRDFFKSEFDTVVIDSIDFLENLLHKHLCETNNWKSMSQLPFGGCFAIAHTYWLEILEIVDSIVMSNKNIVFIGHSIIKRMEAPDQDGFDKYTVKMNQKHATDICAKMDAVLFAQLETIVKTDRVDEERLRAITTGKRILRTNEAPAYLAKNRFNLLPTEPLDGSILTKIGL